MHHPVSYDISVGLKILRANVIKGISRNLQNTTEKSHIRAGPEEPQKALAPYCFQREKFPLCKSCDVWGLPGVKKNNGLKPGDASKLIFFAFLKFSKSSFFHQKIFIFLNNFDPKRHHPMSSDFLVGFKKLRAKVIEGISRNTSSFIRTDEHN